MSARIADLTLSDAWLRARRYRPLVLTVAVTLGALRLAPDGPGAPVADAIAAPGPLVTQTVAPDRSGPSGSAPGAGPVPVTTGLLPDVPLARPATPATRSGQVAIGGPPPSRSTPETAAPDPDPIDGAGARPPLVRYTAWASTEAGTPLASLGVPAQALPVSSRLGQLTKASFLRTGGDWSVLVLDVEPEGTTPVPDLVLRACAITTAEWEPGGEQRFSDAPEWSDVCTDGASDDGGWSFRLDEIEHPFGVAIVPGPEAPLDFQVNLRDPRSAS